jgi:hypothetical protein
LVRLALPLPKTAANESCPKRLEKGTIRLLPQNCMGTGDDVKLDATRWSIARLDSRDSCGSLGSAKALEINPAGGKQIVNAAL